MSAEIKAGDDVEVRDIVGQWHPMVARSGPRVDYEHAIRTPYMSIAVGPWGDLHSVNWPAEDVRLRDIAALAGGGV